MIRNEKISQTIKAFSKRIQYLSQITCISVSHSKRAGFFIDLEDLVLFRSLTLKMTNLKIYIYPLRRQSNSQIPIILQFQVPICCGDSIS